MERKATSHKGQNGRVLVVGGNETYHGAPILAALAAEKSGADLVHLMVPVQQQSLARSFSAGIIVESFSGRFLKGLDINKLVTMANRADVLVIGNGLGEKAQTLRAVKKILEKSSCKLVIDAAALPVFARLAPLNSGRDVVITPHHGEFEKMMQVLGRSTKTIITPSSLKSLSKEWQATIALKGSHDLILSPSGEFFENTTGHPVMTKGGTGDVLAGLIGGLMAQGMTGFEASKKACIDWGKVGEYVASQKGLEATISEMLNEL